MPDALAHHVDGLTVIAPGVVGAPFTAIQRGALVPHALDALTHSEPVKADPGKCTDILFVLDAPVAPTGKVQLYVAPACPGQLYGTVELHNPLVVPLRDAGVVGTPVAALFTLAGDACPHSLLYTTVMFPLVYPGRKVMFILFVVELPVALGGNVHAYVPGPAEGTMYVCVVLGHTVNTPLIAPKVL
jgi:hypothetical protein